MKGLVLPVSLLLIVISRCVVAQEVIVSRRVYAPAGRSFHQLWVWSPDTGAFEQLTRAPRDHHDPSCAANGSDIDFSSGDRRLRFDRGAAIEMPIDDVPATSRDGPRADERIEVRGCDAGTASRAHDASRVACAVHGQAIAVVEVRTERELERLPFSPQSSGGYAYPPWSLQSAWAPDDARLLVGTYGYGSTSTSSFLDYFFSEPDGGRHRGKAVFVWRADHPDVNCVVRSTGRQAAHHEDQDGTRKRRDTPTRELRQCDQGNLLRSVQGVGAAVASIAPRCRARDSKSEGTLEPGHIPILLELPANGVKYANGAEAEPLVQRDRRRVRQADAGDDRFDVLALQRVEQCAIERRAAAASHCPRMTVHARFDGSVVGRLRAPTARARVADAGAVTIGRDEQPVRPGTLVIVEPRPPLSSSERVQVEGNRRVDDVVVVDVGQRRKIVERRRTKTGHRCVASVSHA